MTSVHKETYYKNHRKSIALFAHESKYITYLHKMYYLEDFAIFKLTFRVYFGVCTFKEWFDLVIRWFLPMLSTISVDLITNMHCSFNLNILVEDWRNFGKTFLYLPIHFWYRNSNNGSCYGKWRQAIWHAIFNNNLFNSLLLENQRCGIVRACSNYCIPVNTIANLLFWYFLIHVLTWAGEIRTTFDGNDVKLNCMVYLQNRSL